MDKKKSIINITISIFFKILVLLLTIFSKRFLIKYVGNEANGIYSLYTSVIGFLSIADLGVGTAISFSMYAPIVNGDLDKVSALYKLFVKLYLIIGAVIFIAGVCLLPTLPYICKGYSANFNLYVSFLIMLISVSLTYMFSAKVSLINAYKNDYVTTIFNSVSMIFVFALQIILIYFYKSFELYLFARIVGVLIQWILVEIYFNKCHKYLINYNAKLDFETKREVTTKTKAMFMHKIGGLLVNTSDSIIISAFIGVVLLGKYSNYVTIMTSMTSVLVLFFTPLTAIIGHLCVGKDKEQEEKYFIFFFVINFIIGIVFFLGYYAIIDDVIFICFGDGLELEKSISFVITLNYFIQFMRQACLLFRDATGTFYYDRYKPLIEGIINIVSSIILVNIIGIVGVIVATIITNLLICHIVEPYVLYHHVFRKKPIKYYITNYTFILVFTICLCILNSLIVEIENSWLSIIINGFIAVGISIIPIICVFVLIKEFRKKVITNFEDLCRKIKNKLS